jgi:hypothetical protein
VTTQRLEAAGFTYARRFAVVPSFENPRWFVSLDSGAVARGLVQHLHARAVLGHVKRKLASWAARLRLPIWYRDTIVIASRQPAAARTQARRAISGSEHPPRSSAGAPEPAINRKASAAVLAPNGKVLSFVKIAGSEVIAADHGARGGRPAVRCRTRRAIENATPRLLIRR